MAAAIIPLVSAAVAAIGPQIPGIVRMVEGLFGHSAQTQQQDGPVKMGTAVSLLTTALQSLANAGKIPSAPVVDASLPAGLIGAVQQVVDTIKAQGGLADQSVAPSPAGVGVLQPANVPALNLPDGSKWTVTLVRL